MILSIYLSVLCRYTIAKKCLKAVSIIIVNSINSIKKIFTQQYNIISDMNFDCVIVISTEKEMELTVTQ